MSKRFNILLDAVDVPKEWMYIAVNNKMDYIVSWRRNHYE